MHNVLVLLTFCAAKSSGWFETQLSEAVFPLCRRPHESKERHFCRCAKEPRSGKIWRCIFGLVNQLVLNKVVYFQHCLFYMMNFVVNIVCTRYRQQRTRHFYVTHLHSVGVEQTYSAVIRAQFCQIHCFLLLNYIPITSN